MRAQTERRRMKLLMVESSPQERTKLIALFSGRAAGGSYEVLSAASGDEALEIFTNAHPDLILLNIDLKGMSGRSLCQQIREREGIRHTGIVFVANSSDAEDTLAVECLEMGADDVIHAKAKGPVIVARVKAVLRLKAMTDELRSANHRLRLLSMTDDLTGLPNMRCFNQKFMAIIKKCRDGKTGLAVIMLDLDHFKSVNDTANHLVGSFVLSSLGKLIRSCPEMSEEDIIARYGGDEFVIYIPTDDFEEAKHKAECIRKLVREATTSHDGVDVRLTASIGVAWTEKGFKGRAEDLVKAADLMLYRSKEAGRDRVSSMLLKYPVDLDHVDRSHIVTGQAVGDEEVDEVNAEDSLPRAGGG